MFWNVVEKFEILWRLFWIFSPFEEEEEKDDIDDRIIHPSSHGHITEKRRRHGVLKYLNKCDIKYLSNKNTINKYWTCFKTIVDYNHTFRCCCWTPPAVSSGRLPEERRSTNNRRTWSSQVRCLESLRRFSPPWIIIFQLLRGASLTYCSDGTVRPSVDDSLWFSSGGGGAAEW